MNRITFSLLGSIILFSHVIAQQLPGETNAAASAPAESTSTESESGLRLDDREKIEQSAAAYVNAFNSADADGIANLFAEGAELVDSSGNLFKGRATILKEYKAFFAATPDAKMSVIIERIQPLSATLAIEEGRAQTIVSKEAGAIESRYTAVHQKTGDSWQLVRVQDFDDPPVDPGANLESLDWMIGRWVEESDQSLIKIDCYWHETGAYLIRNFELRVGGLVAATGTERIGWDPLRKQIRSWLFDSAGGYLEGEWTGSGGSWTVVARGFRSDGLPTKATYRVTSLRRDAYHMASFNRTAGDDLLDDLDMTIVRQPPAPGIPVESTDADDSAQ